MEERERWWKMGLKAISDGKLGVLLLSGGQVCLIVHHPLIDELSFLFFLLFGLCLRAMSRDLYLRSFSLVDGEKGGYLVIEFGEVSLSMLVHDDF